jgi:hypothetical protein
MNTLFGVLVLIVGMVIGQLIPIPSNIPPAESYANFSVTCHYQQSGPVSYAFSYEYTNLEAHPDVNFIIFPVCPHITSIMVANAQNGSPARFGLGRNFPPNSDVVVVESPRTIKGFVMEAVLRPTGSFNCYHKLPWYVKLSREDIVHPSKFSVIGPSCTT